MYRQTERKHHNSTNPGTGHHPIEVQFSYPNQKAVHQTLQHGLRATITNHLNTSCSSPIVCLLLLDGFTPSPLWKTSP